MVSTNPYQGTDGYDALTRVDIENTVAIYSSTGVIIRVKYYTNSDDYYAVKVRYTTYQQKKDAIRKYLRKKKFLQMQSGWNRPLEMFSPIDGRSKQPVFKNHAMNSKRGN